MDVQAPLDSSSSSSSTNPPPLLRLSNELLDTIFSLVRKAEGQSRRWRAPICRRLLPFQRAHLYRRVLIKSYTALKRFVRTITATSSIAELVRHLDFDTSISYAENVEAAGARRRRSGLDDEEDDRKLVTPVDFAALVPRLVNLESLATSRLDPSLLDVVFLDQATSSRLASLKKLDFSSPFGPLVQDGCDMGAWMQRLASLPRLADLTLRENHHEDSILPDMPVPPTFPRLERLALEMGTLEDDRWEGPALDRMAPNLVHLELEGRHARPFASALASAPVSLRILSLTNNDDYHAWDDGTSSINAVDDGIVPDAFLLALLADPSNLPNLETLELNHVKSTKGRTVEENHGAIAPVEERHSNPHWPMWKRWVAPEYPDGVTENGQLRVLLAALARNVFVAGKARETIDWRDAFEAEQRIALFALGDLTGEYRRAREVVGAEAVNAHILARMQARAASLEGVEAVKGEEDGEA
ncbi:hypothetical protein JCM9279_002062 [Rhodotorula babjevae]